MELLIAVVIEVLSLLYLLIVLTTVLVILFMAIISCSKIGVVLTIEVDIGVVVDAGLIS